jgi:cell wall-associated NlpC family hydrolase
LARQIEATNQYITSLGEQYDAAQLRLQTADDNIARTQAELDGLRRQISSVKALIVARAASDYRAEVAGRAVAPLDLDNAEQLSVRAGYAGSQAERDKGNLQQLAAELRSLRSTQQEAQQAHADADAARQSLASTKQQLESANEAQVVLLSHVQGQLVDLLPDQQRRLLDADLASAVAEFAPGSADGGDPSLFPGLPPVDPAAGLAIAYARAQLGKPYVYAAAGPGAFDCSGLVMAAFGFAGINLPHYSGAQYELLPHISLAAVQPGDLLFWGIGGSQHVAIYVGLGRILEAGGTGHDVHVGPIWGRPVGAARVL